VPFREGRFPISEISQWRRLPFAREPAAAGHSDWKRRFRLLALLRSRCGWDLERWREVAVAYLLVQVLARVRDAFCLQTLLGENAATLAIVGFRLDLGDGFAPVTAFRACTQKGINNILEPEIESHERHLRLIEAHQGARQKRQKRKICAGILSRSLVLRDRIQQGSFLS
jgi:hypothetical protein